MKTPYSISPNPIVEATIELKFKSSLPKGAIFGIIYNVLKHRFQQVEKLQTAMLPVDIIENDPNLKYKALYKINDGKFVAQIGYDVITFHSPMPYIGWDAFAKETMIFFELIKSTGTLEQVDSFTLRYLNFFELDVYPHLTLEISMFATPYRSDNIIFRTEMQDQDFIKILQFANNVTASSSNEIKKGSLLDITCTLNQPEHLFNNFQAILNQAHDLEKNLFFSLLKESYLKTLNPIYEND